MRRSLSAMVVTVVVALAAGCNQGAPASATGLPAATATVPTTPDLEGTVTARVQATLAPKPTIAVTAQEIQVGPVLFASGPLDTLTAAAFVKNPNMDLWMPTEPYTVTAYDQAGHAIGNHADVLSLGPGEERWVVIMQMNAPRTVVKVDFQLRRSKGFQPVITDPAPRLTLTQSTFQPSAGVSRQVGLVRNDGTVDVPQVRIDVVYFDSAGGLLGTATGFISNLAAGQTESFAAPGPSAPKSQPADSKTYVIPELLR